MPTFSHAAVLALALTFLGGCCRDTIREMASIKDVTQRAPERRDKAEARGESKSAKIDRRDDDDDDDDKDRKKIETGSIKGSECQGPHIAYQATREYLKNFGPKPPDQPGEKGPCRPDGR